MNVRWIEADATISAGRGEAVVCIPVYNGHHHFVSCLHSVLAHTPVDVPILICDDASPDTRSREFVAKLEQASDHEHDLYYLRREANLGFPGNVNGAFDAAAPADVVIVNSDVVVAEGWLDGLRAAAYADSRAATATALTNHGSVVSVPERKPMPQLPADWDFDDAAAAVRAGSLRIHPRLPTAIGHCVYVRRSALELVGGFDLAFSPGYGEEVDFSQRCLHAGLSHVLADDVLVLHHGGGTFSPNGKRDPIQDQHERLIQARYPYYRPQITAVEEDSTGPLARALGAARRAIKGMSVLIDARTLAGPMTGTQLQVLEVILALARTDSVHLKVLVPPDLSAYAESMLRAASDLTLVEAPDLAWLKRDPVDVVHRPHQIHTQADVTLLAPLGERLVVTNQDLISFHNPSYFRDHDAWHGYRRLTRAALAVADRVVFVSAHARDDALAEDLLEAGRAEVVHNGVDHSLTLTRGEPVPPRGAERLPDDAPAILCIGTDFRHKNRVFALRVVEQLRRRHDWDGHLLFVGPHVAEGGSQAEEVETIALHPGLASRVIDFAAVTEAEKAWLYRRARLVLFPTVYEGFGLIPFEAADHDIPCMWAHTTSLAELLPESAAAIVAWNEEETADRAFELLGDAGARERNLAAIRASAAGLTWDAAAAKLLGIYRAACEAPPTSASGLERRGGVMAGALSEDAMRLLGPGGALPTDVERPLLALATHPQIGTPMFEVIKFGYRASYRLRRRARRSDTSRGQS